MINFQLVTINLCISGYQRMHLYQHCSMDRYSGVWIAKPNPQQFELNSPEYCQFTSAPRGSMINSCLITINLDSWDTTECICSKTGPQIGTLVCRQPIKILGDFTWSSPIHQFISAAPCSMINFRQVHNSLRFLRNQRMHLHQHCSMDRYSGVWIAKP